MVSGRVSGSGDLDVVLEAQERDQVSRKMSIESEGSLTQIESNGFLNDIFLREVNDRQRMNVEQGEDFNERTGKFLKPVLVHTAPGRCFQVKEISSSPEDEAFIDVVIVHGEIEPLGLKI